jgi:hypothetical protein
VSSPLLQPADVRSFLREAVQGLVDALLVSLTVGGYLLYVRWLASPVVSPAGF